MDAPLPAVWLARARASSRRRPRRPTGERAPRRLPTPRRGTAVALHGERRHQAVQRAWRFLLAIVGDEPRLLLALERQARALPAARVPGARAAHRRRARARARRALAPAARRSGAARSSRAAVARRSRVGRRGALGAGARSPRDARRRPSTPSGSLAFGGGVAAVAVGAVAAWVVLRRNGVAALRRARDRRRGARRAVELAAFQLLYPALDAVRSPRPIAVAAAAVTPDGRADRPRRPTARWSGGLVYYGGRPRRGAALAREHPRASSTAGGRTFVVKQRKLERVDRRTCRFAR